MISGGIGDDWIIGADQAESLSGGFLENDGAWWLQQGDWLLGGDGNDMISGSRNRDMLNGGAGKDYIWGNTRSALVGISL